MVKSFGYVILDTGECEEHDTWRDAREFIHVQSDEDELSVHFASRRSFDLETGKRTDLRG